MANLYQRLAVPNRLKQYIVLLCSCVISGLLIVPGAFSQSADSDLLSVTLKNRKMIYSRREGIQVELTFKAKAPVDLCLRENPLSQLNVSVARAGVGQLKIQPIVDQQLPETWKSQNRVHHLKSGETWQTRLNLRQLSFFDGDSWQPGEYSVDGEFLLCEQGQPPSRFGVDMGEETPIPFEGSIYFLIAH